LKKGASGKYEIAKKNNTDAKTIQSNLTTALADANSSYTHWKDDLVREEAKVAGLLVTVNADKGTYDGLVTDVNVFTKTVTDTAAAFKEKKALFAI